MRRILACSGGDVERGRYGWILQFPGFENSGFVDCRIVVPADVTAAEVQLALVLRAPETSVGQTLSTDVTFHIAGGQPDTVGFSSPIDLNARQTTEIRLDLPAERFASRSLLTARIGAENQSTQLELLGVYIEYVATR